MIIEVGRYDIGIILIRRVLDRGEGVDVLARREDDDAARMLARGPADAFAALGYADDLAAPLLQPVLLAVVHGVAVGRLLGQGADRAGLEGLALAKDDLRIAVGLTLVVAGEIEVDIRLLISFESKEGLEGDIKAHLLHGGPALGTDTVRHIAAGPAGLSELQYGLRIEVREVALGAEVVGPEGINLRDSGHGGYKGGTDGSPGADQIPVLDRLPHQLLGDDVHDGIAVSDDGIEFPLQPLGNHRGQILPVELVGLVIADFPQHLVGIRNNGRALVRPGGLDDLAHVGNLVCVFYDNLVGLLSAQVGELIQHLLRGMEEEGRLHVAVVEAPFVHDDPAVNLVLGV